MPDESHPDGHATPFQRFMSRVAAAFLTLAILFSLKVAYDKMPQSKYATPPAEPFVLAEYRAPATPTPTPTPKPTPKRTPRPTPTRTPKPAVTPTVAALESTPPSSPTATSNPGGIVPSISPEPRVFTPSNPTVGSPSPAAPVAAAPLEPSFRFTTPTPYPFPIIEGAAPASSATGPAAPHAVASPIQPQPAPLEEFEPRGRIQIGGPNRFASSRPDEPDADPPAHPGATSQPARETPAPTSGPVRPPSASSSSNAHAPASSSPSSRPMDAAPKRPADHATSISRPLVPASSSPLPERVSQEKSEGTRRPPTIATTNSTSLPAIETPAPRTPASAAASAASAPIPERIQVTPPSSHSTTLPASQPASPAPALSSRAWWEVVGWNPESREGRAMLTVKVQVKDLENLNEKQFAGLCRHIVETAGLSQNKIQVEGKGSALPGTIRVEAVSALTSAGQNGQWRGVAEWRRADGAIDVIAAPKAEK